MKASQTVAVELGRWPPRPEGEVFPELLTTTDVAQLLRYDARPGVTPEKGARMVRLLARDKGLPTLARVGRSLLFSKAAVLSWLESRGNGQRGAEPTDGVSEPPEPTPDETGTC